MLFFDWHYFVYVALPILALGFLASNWVKRTYQRYSQVRNASGLSGVDVARRILTGAGLSDVTIQVIDGELNDNYDPRTRTLNLSRAVATGTSVAAEAVVAHEIGHAQQDRQGFFAMRIRSGLVPAANLGSQAGPLIVIASFDGAQAVLWEAALSFLGLGVQPPAPSFGSMLREAQSYLSIQPWLAIVAGVAVSAVILGLNLLGDALSDYYDRAGR